MCWTGAVVGLHGGAVVFAVHAGDTDPHADHDTDKASGCQHCCMATEDLASNVGLTCATLLTGALLALCLFG